MAKKALGRGLDSLFQSRYKKDNDQTKDVSSEKKEEIKIETIHEDTEKPSEITELEIEKKEEPVIAKEASADPVPVIEKKEEDLKAEPQEKKSVLEYVISIPVERIRPNMYQPRRNFDEEMLRELAESIKENGLLQPITVWKDDDKEYYEIIAGERRLRACKLAGMTEINAIVRENLSDEKKLELALIENIQREDLNAIDTALAYRQLIDHFGLSQADISRIVGKSRAAISNTLRLMELEENIRNSVRSGLISEGHARALLAIPDKAKRQQAFQKIVAERMTVREAEELAQNYHLDLPDEENAVSRRIVSKAPEIIDMQSMLSRHFGSRVEIKPSSNGKKGKIVISYYTLDDFERITSILRR